MQPSTSPGVHVHATVVPLELVPVSTIPLVPAAVVPDVVVPGSAVVPAVVASVVDVGPPVVDADVVTAPELPALVGSTVVDVDATDVDAPEVVAPAVADPVPVESSAQAEVARMQAASAADRVREGAMTAPVGLRSARAGNPPHMALRTCSQVLARLRPPRAPLRPHDRVPSTARVGPTDDTQVVPGDDPLTGASTIVAPPSITHDGALASAGTILATADGSTSTQQRPGAEASSSGSGPRRLAPGTRVGRYSLAEPLGAGGMGVVYRAHDPELERQVAIKVLRSDRAEQRDGGRFLREAQAMAKLSHPNVVPIHDVGRWDSGLFLAMELIEGETLRKWLQGAVRGWREVAEMFVQAGRGLAEAHAAGIVHRDFKPENVLVDRRDRPRVTDFGLARPDGTTLAPDGSQRIGSSHLTRSGTILGTPAYMAPEQLAGRPVDAKADVFAFCATFYEALHGHTPFAGRTFAERIEAIESGALRLPNRRLPRWLLRALVRGLAFRPEARPDMPALLAQLERGLARRRSAWLAGAFLVALTAGLVAAFVDRGPRCDGAEDRLAGVWDLPTQQAVAAALRASGRSYAEDTWSKVHGLVDSYVEAWTALQQGSCEAHHRGEISSSLLDRRAVCLGERRADLKLLVDTLREADAATVEKATLAAQRLPPIDGCLDPQAAEVRDATQLAWAEATRARIARVRLLDLTGKLAEGLKQIHEVEAEAANRGDEALRLEAMLARARLEQARGAHDEASQAARAVFEGAFGRGRDRLAVQAAILLVLIDGGARARYELGEAWADVALAGVKRIGDDGREEAAARQYYGAMLSSADRSAEALVQLEKAYALRTSLLGPDDLDTSLTAMTLGNALWKVGRLEEARRFHEAAVRSRESALGREHPALIAPLANLGVTEEALGNLAEARVSWSRSLALIETNLSKDHPNAAALHANLASLEIAIGDLAAARRHSEAALRIARATYGADHPDTALIQSNYANLLVKQGELDAAEAAMREALAATERSVGADHSNHAAIGVTLGRLLRHRGRADEARTVLERALATVERSLGAGHPRVAECLLELAAIDLAAGDLDPALARLDRAVTLIEAAEVKPEERGRIVFALARALAERRRDPARAAALLARAEELSQQSGLTGAELRAEIAAWKLVHPAAAPPP
jgi:tetratricopeptide (TPR) repeat protein/predicted Ser/Thr protein kinase